MFGDIKACFQIVRIDQDRQGFRNAAIYDMRDQNVQTKVLSNTIIQRNSVYPMSHGNKHQEYGLVPPEDEIIPDVEKPAIRFENATRKVLTNLPEFLVTRQDVEESDGWHLADYSVVEACLQMVKQHLTRARLWYICRLQGGKIGGPGYQYGMDEGDYPTLGHKLLMRYPREFSIIPTKRILPSWKLATVDDVKAGFKLVEALLSKRPGQVCLLQRGTVTGSVGGFQLRETEGNEFILADYQLVVRLDKVNN